ncbi:MAG: GNAT family N-acetyltransferase [Defluviitaleaceae bacterium]|nr:GNAT family N-acetyltransferase [Defluviitaleaceae bacterium]
MEYIKASDLPFDPRPQMGRIFAEGFYEHGLKFLSKDKAKLARATAHIFVLDKFFVAVENGEIMAMVGVTAQKPPPAKADKKILINELGFIRGRVAYWALNKFVINPPAPVEIPEDMCIIEFVATSLAHTRKGIAFKLLSHVMEILHFDGYMLEVVDVNAGAISLYEKLGFREFSRKPSPSKRSGFNFFLYMKTDRKVSVRHDV